jgi:hypothetical protein
LSQNYPNPFNPATTIQYRVPDKHPLRVRLCLFDLLGREIAVLVDERREPGSHAVRFDGGGLSSGVYILRLWGGSCSTAKRVLLVR